MSQTQYIVLCKQFSDTRAYGPWSDYFAADREAQKTASGVKTQVVELKPAGKIEELQEDHPEPGITIGD